MKPTNKLQRRVVELASLLPSISEKQSNYAFDKCFDHLGFRNKKGVTCMECGHVFFSELNACVCPHCSSKIQIQDTLKRTCRNNEFMCIVTTCDEFQVLRIVDVIQVYRKGEKAVYYCREVVQNWITESGHLEVISRLRANCFSYNYSWSWDSNMELRRYNNSHSVCTKCFYPVRTYIPCIKRNGFKGNFCGFSPLTLFRELLANAKAETLFKARQYNILSYLISHSYSANSIWPFAKLCMRNNYFPKDVSMWVDYIDMLKYFKKDISKPQLICPDNLKREHDLLLKEKKRLREISERKENLARDRERERIADHDGNIRRFFEKSRFFGVEFSDDLIKVKVLQTIEEYEEEAEILDHCVFENEYFGKPDTLILSARIDDKPLETIEISLVDFKILQCRGRNNQKSNHHDRIFNLVKTNIRKLRKRNLEKISA